MAQRQHEKQSHAERVQQAAVVIARDAAEARKALDKALVALAKDPGNTELQAEVAQLESELEGYARASRRNAQMREAAARADSVTEQQAELKNLKASVKSISKLLDEMAAATVEAGRVAGELASKRAEVHNAAVEARREAWKVLRATLGQQMAERKAGATLGQLTAGYADVLMAAALSGRVDGTLVSAVAPSYSRPVDEALERVKFRLLTVLQQSIADHEQNLEKQS